MDIKPNSNKAKNELIVDEARKVDKVVKGTTTRKSESVGRKLSDTFLSEDAQDVKSYILFDVFIPAVKDMVVDLITNGTNMLFYGRGSSRRSSGPSSRSSRVDYSGYSKQSRASHPTRQSSERYSYDDISFAERGDALEVRDCLVELLDRYKMVSVADYYEMAGLETSYTDSKYGWFDLDGMTIARDRDGYKIKLPKAVPLD